MRELVDDWIARAEEDLGLARLALTQGTVYLHGMGFLAQQAAEKYLKAFLTDRQVEFPKTHNLEELLELVEMVDASLATGLHGVAELTPFAVDARYPGGPAPATREEAQRAIELAEQARAAVLKALGRAI